MSATQTLAVEKILVKHNFTEQETTQILDYVDSQRGDTATKQFVSQETSVVRKDLKQEIKGVKNELMSEIDGIKRDVNWLKWIVGLGFTIGLGTLLTIMLYLHADTKQEMKELKAEMKELKAEMKDLKAEMKENQKLILQLLQKK